jgi:serine phosphatase RsbU (regulator of sigma subunit)/ligand-binding sensor domain-containing protein
MRSRPIIILTLSALVVSQLLQAQPNKYGVPLITNYPYYETRGTEQNWCITQDPRGVVYVANQSKGVLEYDGVEWRSIPTPNEASVFSLATGEDGLVYAGCDNDLGRLEPDASGRLLYHSFCDSAIRDQFPYFQVWRTYSEDNRIYFCAQQVIFVYNIQNGKISAIGTPDRGYNSYLLNGELYHSNVHQGLMHYDGSAFTAVKGGEVFSEKLITGMLPYDTTHLLISTMFSGLYLFNTETGRLEDSFIDPELLQVLTDATITYMGSLENRILVGTFLNGLYILGHNLEVLEIISENEGLIDQVIAYAYTNKSLKGAGPIWIAHWKGVSKLEPNNPFRRFTAKSGFDGLIHDIAEFNGILFISTSQGLYYKSSTASSTQFVPVPEVQEQIWKLHVMKPYPGKQLLLASGIYETFVIDDRLNVSTVRERIINPPENEMDMDEYSGRTIIQDPDRPDVIYTGMEQLIGLKYEWGRWREILRIRDIDAEIYNFGLDKYGYFWLSTNRGVLRLDVSVAQEPTMKAFTEASGLPDNPNNNIFIDPERGEVLLGTKNSFYRYDYFNDTLLMDTLYNSVLPAGKNSIQKFHLDQDGDFWFSFENERSGWTEILARKKKGGFEILSDRPFQRLPNASVDVFYNDNENGVWFSKSDELYHFDKANLGGDTISFRTLIRRVILNDTDSALFNGTAFRTDAGGAYSIEAGLEIRDRPDIPYRYNNIEFHWAAPYFEQEDRLLYSYKLLGYSDTWSEWQEATFKEFTNLKFGNYTFYVKALNVYGHESLPARYSFGVNRPWYASIPARITYILLLGLLVYVIIKLYTRRLKNENLRLEGIIEERTAEIRKQKEELTDSIEYASRIQRALLPSEELMDDHNIEHFILFRPRDIVSGDFYWIGQKEDKLLIVAADCTGHGVPGAFMSMLGMTFLDEIVIKSEITHTAEIMEALREHVVTSLEQSHKSVEEAVKDGMDLAMISVDMKTQMIQYSGAYNPLYLVRKLKRGEQNKISKGEELDLPRGSIHDNDHLLIQLKADQMPIGASEKDMPFNATTIKDEGYNIYMFSDGFLDQFGGPQGKKFMSKNFKKLLLELQSVPLREQGAAMEKVLLGWMGEISQIDDILVMGLRMNPQ